MAERRDDPEIFWVDPRQRGILPIDGFHVSRSLAKRLRRSDYTVALTTAFGDVIDGCADRSETWINAEIRELYLELSQRGHAHSLEVWQGDALVGGVYGVSIGRAFCGESMFSRITDGSKIALSWLIAHLRQCGYTLFDTQFLTPHLASLGAIEIPRAQYHARLAEALEGHADAASRPLPRDGVEVVDRLKQAQFTTQRNTQTS